MTKIANSEVINLLEIVSELLSPAAVYTVTTPQNFLELLGPTYVKSLLALSEIKSPEELLKELQLFNPTLVNECPTFVFFTSKGHNSKKSIKWNLISNPPYLYTFDPITKEETKSSFPCESIIKKGKNTLKIHYIDGSTSDLYFISNSTSFYDFVSQFLLKNNTLKPFDTFIECCRYCNKYPKGFKALEQHIVNLFTQSNYIPIRHLYTLRVDSRFKRIIGTSLVKINSSKKMLCFYLNYITALYFENPPSPQEIMRADSLLTNSLGAVRDVFTPNFYRVITDYLISETKNFNTKEEVLSGFIKLVKTFPIPGILRWICWMLYTEAKRVFPEGDGPYYSVSNFFFLRGLGPVLTSISDQDAKKKCILITGLINFSAKPEYQQFIPLFKELISEISLNINESNLVQAITEDELTTAVWDLVGAIEENIDAVTEILHKDLPGKHPMQWFIERQYEAAKAYKSD
ncbi:hypothetical protein GPJ56_010819 [Histomonas meleagridis]|uniref:uncharacterized protein n=1 Tax=Histomonas meleagridis TaxID=135588 RepID=UPI00355A030B|nr:hypothetical protein GPJ56_010819 [Histomonas meleagridis]KAH0801156.1 hypothetical protein GO595_006191 [Histomonas meleagridis]